MEEIRELMSLAEEHWSEDNRFILAIASFMEAFGTAGDAMMKGIMEDSEYSRPATVAEKFGCLLSSRFYDSLYYGLLVRAYESELQKMDELGETNPDKKASLEEGLSRSLSALERVTGYLEENLNYRVVPIRTLVAIQLESGLIVAEHLKSQLRR